MRETQSTEAIFDKALQWAQSLNVTHVKHVHLAIGEMVEFDQTMIQFHWTELSRGTLLEHAQLQIRSITAEAQCMACFKKYHPENRTIHCPNCGSYGAKMLSGEEFYCESIEADSE